LPLTPALSHGERGKGSPHSLSPLSLRERVRVRVEGFCSLSLRERARVRVEGFVPSP